MNDHTTLKLAEELLREFRDRLYLDTAQIRKILEGEEELVTRCLDFLVGRDELMMAAGRSPLFYHRNNVIRAMIKEMEGKGFMDAELIAMNVGIPIATTCEILGWLERDNRVQAKHVGEDVLFCCR